MSSVSIFFAYAQTEFHFYLNISIIIFRLERWHLSVCTLPGHWYPPWRINSIGKVSDSSPMPCDEQTNAEYFFSSGSATGIGPEISMKSENKTGKWFWVMSVLWRTIDQPNQSQSHQFANFSFGICFAKVTKLIIITSMINDHKNWTITKKK